jgi:hypothetical protein
MDILGNVLRKTVKTIFVHTYPALVYTFTFVFYLQGYFFVTIHVCVTWKWLQHSDSEVATLHL